MLIDERRVECSPARRLSTSHAPSASSLLLTDITTKVSLMLASAAAVPAQSAFSEMWLREYRGHAPATARVELVLVQAIELQIQLCAARWLGPAERSFVHCLDLMTREELAGTKNTMTKVCADSRVEADGL